MYFYSTSKLGINYEQRQVTMNFITVHNGVKDCVRNNEKSGRVFVKVIEGTILWGLIFTIMIRIP